MDFTLKKYNQLLNTLINNEFNFFSFNDFPAMEEGKSIMLRHDVDKLPGNSLEFAKIQSSFGIRGVYYFRVQPDSFNEKIITKVCKLGHDIGYHYEDLSLAASKLEQSKIKDYDREKHLVSYAIESFSRNLEKLRKIVPVKTICMHGDPLNKWDSRLLWKYYRYMDFGVETEPYFDFIFDDILYLTDTGRRWDGQSVSIRDKAGYRDSTGIGVQLGMPVCDDERFSNWTVKPATGSLMNMTAASYDFQKKYRVHSTDDIIKFGQKEKLPRKIMITFHPQRWTENRLLWAKEFVFQNIKNQVKFFLSISR